MSNKKNIDHFFQEKFKDFEANPAHEVWGAIEEKLEEKKRKRVIPLWWKLSGIVAILIIGLILSNLFFKPNTISSGTIVVDKDANQGKKDSTIIAPAKKESVSEVSSTLEEITNNDKTKDNSEPSDSRENLKTSSPTVALQVSAGKSYPYTSVDKSKSGMTNNKSIKNQNSPDTTKNSTSGNSFKEKTTSIANTINHSVLSKEENQITQMHDEGNVLIDSKTKTNPNAINLDVLKGTQNTAVATKEEENKVIDSANHNIATNNPLDELLDKKEKQTQQASKVNRWQLTSNVTPIFFGSIANGSPIDSTLMKNAKSYNTSVGFGLGVSYSVSKKLTVRTGLNKLNMSYNTNNILYFAGIESRALKNINPSAAGSMIQIESGQVNAQSFAPSETDLLPFENSITHKNKGYINQEMGYLEMPLELSYALVDKKFGFKLIGGFSTLLLQENEVNVISDNGNTFLGEASNLNTVHFSTNVGLGIKYGFMKSFEFNVEPTFKYQINTFRSDDGNFKPYVFGIYSGVSYKF
jgi:hypothetical protein